MDNSLPLVRLLIAHGADVDKPDMDSWTPLHAAAANGHVDIAKYLICKGADLQTVTDEYESALDLVDGEDFEMIAVLLGVDVNVVTEIETNGKKEKRSPAWTKGKIEEEEKDTRRKGSAWVKRTQILEEQEDEETVSEKPNCERKVKGDIDSIGTDSKKSRSIKGDLVLAKEEVKSKVEFPISNIS